MVETPAEAGKAPREKADRTPSIEIKKTCTSCGINIFREATACPHCQRSQNMFLKYFDNASNIISFALATFGIAISLVTFFVTSADERIRFLLGERPSLVVSPQFFPSFVEMEYNDYGNASVDVGDVNATLQIFNSGFAVAAIESFYCSAGEDLVAEVWPGIPREGEPLLFGSVKWSAEIEFFSSSGRLVAPGETRNVEFKVLRDSVKISQTGDLEAAQGRDIAISTSFGATCELTYSYISQIGSSESTSQIAFTEASLNFETYATLASVVSSMLHDGVIQSLQKKE